MMRKDQVLATRVHVELGAECDTRQCATFYVPTGSASAPWTHPPRLVLLLPRFPQSEIVRMPLFLVFYLK
jgi:hypothetical protein